MTGKVFRVDFTPDKRAPFKGGKVEVLAVRFRNDGGFSIVSVITGAHDFTAVGVMPALYPGDIVHLDGKWVTHPQYGEQFQVSAVRRGTAMPSTPRGVQKWLQSRLMWVGPITATRLVKKYGAGLWDIIEKNPSELVTLRGLTQERVDELVRTYNVFKDEMKLRTWLYEIGLGERQADAAVNNWQDCKTVISNNPYLLMFLPGVTFVDADTVGTSYFKIEKDDLRRCEAALVQVIEDRCKEKGHTYLPLQVALTLAGQLTRCGHEPLRAALASDQRCMGLILVDDGHAVAPNQLYMAEVQIAHRVEKACSTKT